MTTNATLLDDEIIALIKRYNFGLMISMDGPAGRTRRDAPDGRRQRLLRRGGAQRQAADAATTLGDRALHAEQSMLDRPRIVRFLEEFGFTRVAMSRCTGTVDGLGPYDIGPAENEILHAQDDAFVERLLDQLARGERIKFNPWASVMRTIHDRQHRRMRCGVGRGCTTVGIDGRLYPCHRYVGMDPYVLGHVETGIDREKFAAYLHGYFETKRKCESCWAINLCGGYCPWYVSSADGTFKAPEDWWCEDIRHWFERGVWLYETLRRDYPDYLGQLVGDDTIEPLLRLL